MAQQYHILNGDALKAQFPEDIQGTRIVLRECLVDGPVAGSTLKELYAIRAQFISENYAGYTAEDYYHKTVLELEKIVSIPEKGAVCLWFEDDLFCQVNFWFSVHLLHQKQCRIFLIRPVEHNQYGFAALDKKELVSLYNKRLPLTEINTLSTLWELYRTDDRENLLNTAKDLSLQYPFILHAAQAYIESKPQGDFPGRPIATLREIIGKLKTEQFEPVFQEFCRRESIYGFGDLQVKRLLDTIKDNN